MVGKISGQKLFKVFKRIVRQLRASRNRIIISASANDTADLGPGESQRNLRACVARMSEQNSSAQKNGF